MFSVDIAGDAVLFLGVGHGVQCQRGLSGRLRAKDLHHAAPGKPPDACGDVQREASGRDSPDLLNKMIVAETQQGSASELFFQLRDSDVERLVACGIVIRFSGHSELLVGLYLKNFHH